MQKEKPFFKVSKITDPRNLVEGDVLPTSDYLLTSEENKVIQFEYIDPNKGNEKTEITPGVYTLYYDAVEHQVKHKAMSLVNDRIMKEYSYTEKITKLVDKFFTKLNVYQKRGMFPKRAALLYGPPGASKTTSIIQTVQNYMDGKTAAVVWPTATLRSSGAKEFFREAEFIGVERLIFIVEDVGGGEKQYYGDKMPVDSELLSLLDNSHGTFTIPTIILATTNYPANLLEPLLRTGRFDDLLEVPTPNSDQRRALLKFFADDIVNENEDAITEIAKSKYDNLSVSDLKEIPLKAELDDITMMAALAQLMERKRLIEEDFAKAKARMGIHEA